MRIGILGSGLMGGARAATPHDAAQKADALLLAVHWSRVDEVLSQAGDLSGKVVVSCSLPMNADDTALVAAHTSSAPRNWPRKSLPPASCPRSQRSAFRRLRRDAPGEP